MSSCDTINIIQSYCYPNELKCQQLLFTSPLASSTTITKIKMNFYQISPNPKIKLFLCLTVDLECKFPFDLTETPFRATLLNHWFLLCQRYKQV